MPIWRLRRRDKTVTGNWTKPFSCPPHSPGSVRSGYPGAFIHFEKLKCYRFFREEVLSPCTSTLWSPNIPFNSPCSNTLDTRSSIKQNLKGNIKLVLMGMASEDGRLMELTQNRVWRLALVLTVIKSGPALPESYFSLKRIRRPKFHSLSRRRFANRRTWPTLLQLQPGLCLNIFAFLSQST